MRKNTAWVDSRERKWIYSHHRVHDPKAHVDPSACGLQRMDVIPFLLREKRKGPDVMELSVVVVHEDHRVRKRKNEPNERVREHVR